MAIVKIDSQGVPALVDTETKKITPFGSEDAADEALKLITAGILPEQVAFEVCALQGYGLYDCNDQDLAELERLGTEAS